MTGTASVSGGDTSTVYFTSGLTNEAHGLFAGITNVTTAGSTPTFNFSTSSGGATVTAGGSTQTTISTAPANGFSGSINLACTGLPLGAACTFSPTTISVSPTAITTVSVTIQTTKATASLRPYHFYEKVITGITSALLLPFASLAALRRRRPLHNRQPLQLLVVLASVALGGFLVGCGGYTAPVTPTPVGQSTVTIAASSGAISQQTSFALTVQ